MAKGRKKEKKNGVLAVPEESKVGYGDKKLEGPNRPAE